MPSQVVTASGPRTTLRKRVHTRLGRRRTSPSALSAIAGEYEVASDVIEQNGALPLTWWVRAPNFGDLLSPWLIGKMTGRQVVFADKSRPHYIAVGSILKRASPQSIVWGSGSFGNENRDQLVPEATYTAVRGPLSRARLLDVEAKVPEVYGDPALLTPLYFRPKVKKTHDIGIVARWSEKRWAEAQLGPGVKLIDLGTDDVEGVLREIMSCRQIVTASLHGLVIADAYGIPNAWVLSRTAAGGEFKYLDYFASVDKFRLPQGLKIKGREVTVAYLRSRLDFDARPITFDFRRLLDACPFMERRPTA
ncbi:polysaccharide pyruvyl transferase family protein [Mumia zhuanghuii]|uniref:polysaccharide pyruvyl transferase family protein n=1 Tax=Mumia zhuanghuii TaxID=2585211 RepID=UPI00363C340E